MSLFRNRKHFDDAPAADQVQTDHVKSRATAPISHPPKAPLQLPSERGPGIQEVRETLRQLQILLHTRRLYHHSHPKNLESLESTFNSLQRLAQTMNGVEFRVEREGIVVPKLSEAPIPDAKGELKHLASDFQLAGIQTLVVLRQFHVGELDTLAQLIRAALLKSDESSAKKRSSWWTAKLLEYGVEGIRVNGQTDHKVDTVLTSLIAALVSFGGNSASENADAPITAPTNENLSDVLRLIARPFSRGCGSRHSWCAR